MAVSTFAPPRKTANPAPLRRAASIRRTASIDVAWPDGPRGDKALSGRARDLITAGGGGRGCLVAEASFEVELRRDYTIRAISAVPDLPELQRLAGESSGGRLRKVIREAMPTLVAAADPLHLLLDDIPGVSLVCGWAWSQWPSLLGTSEMEAAAGRMARMLEKRVDACWGLRRGSTGLAASRQGDVSTADAGELRNPADPSGWHDFPQIAGVTMRRARRIDLWRGEDGLIQIESAFQDSASRPGGGRAAVHEYCLRASADPANLELMTIEPEARVLPFGECPGAIDNTIGLIGSSLPAIRESVRNDLRGPRGCTHLNDALRALADVPILLRRLDRALADR